MMWLLALFIVVFGGILWVAYKRATADGVITMTSEPSAEQVRAWTIERTREAEVELEGLTWRENGVNHPFQHWYYGRAHPSVPYWSGFRLAQACREIIRLGGYGYGVVDMLEEFVQTTRAISVEGGVPFGNVLEISEIACGLQTYYDDVLKKLQAEDDAAVGEQAERNRHTLKNIAALVASLKEDTKDEELCGSEDGEGSTPEQGDLRGEQEGGLAT